MDIGLTVEKLQGDKNINSYLLADQLNLDLIRCLPHFLTNRNLFRLSIDGSSNKILHAKCDHVPGILVIAKVNDGVVLGAFTTLPWRSPPQGRFYREDLATYDPRYSFLFVLHNKYNKMGVKMPLKKECRGKCMFH